MVASTSKRGPEAAGTDCSFSSFAGALSGPSTVGSSSSVSFSTRKLIRGPRASAESGSAASSTVRSATRAGASKRTWTTPGRSVAWAPTTLTSEGLHFVASATASANLALKSGGRGPFTRTLRRASPPTFSFAASLPSRSFSLATSVCSEAPPAAATRLASEIAAGSEPAFGAALAWPAGAAFAWAVAGAAFSTSWRSLWWCL
mmetsp:Transcript_5578/g.15051  ORF Transcript_5578/g.15051 Transcript_5578/m.15051 type:complete len:203 (-) Transcript_5578:67-675(-)